MSAKALAAEIFLVEPKGLDHGPHSPVQKQDPFRKEPAKYALGFYHHRFL